MRERDRENTVRNFDTNFYTVAKSEVGFCLAARVRNLPVPKTGKLKTSFVIKNKWS